MSVQDSPLANHVREQHLLKATHSHQLPAAAASSGRNTSHQPTLESLLEGTVLWRQFIYHVHLLYNCIGYQLSNTEGYPVLSIDFNDGGSVWSKLIWTRKSLPRVLYRWNTPEVMQLPTEIYTTNVIIAKNLFGIFSIQKCLCCFLLYTQMHLLHYCVSQEILSYLISFDRHKSWITADILTRFTYYSKVIQSVVCSFVFWEIIYKLSVNCPCSLEPNLNFRTIRKFL